MVLLTLLIDWCCFERCHREDYDFAANVDEKTGEVRKEPLRGLYGVFRDRNLEREYLEFMASRSMGRLGLGFSILFVTIYLVVLAILSTGWMTSVHPEVRELMVPGITPFFPNGLKTLVEVLASITAVLLPFWLGLIGSLIIHYTPRIRQKRFIFLSIELGMAERANAHTHACMNESHALSWSKSTVLTSDTCAQRILGVLYLCYERRSIPSRKYLIRWWTSR